MIWSTEESDLDDPSARADHRAGLKAAAEHGPNALAETKQVMLLERFMRQFRSP